ncbi:DUF1573 domain-containing protein [Tenacibaculum sp. IB213877]|uniref:DUF1573 domain-containing protein n=1 Tax=Tenacibaculum sp. IB213877 TaxID=3097351 RepID=UPI002A5A97B6|nr:DUF1573 domain-containing protein [Tenacibaculum sp. IB213877]MDY0779904.1 DUF1573 domain-containing protein [Tenacibaculum sp. IB213877]
MKKAFIVLSLVILTGVLVSCGNSNASSKVKKENVERAEKRDSDISKGAPAITFDKEVFDFGTVNEGDVVETTFKVTNTGKSNLVITNAKATCGCTVPTWPKEAIEPGETADIQVKFNTSGKSNKQSKTITLDTNTDKATVFLKIKGIVIPKNKTSQKKLKKEFKNFVER